MQKHRSPTRSGIYLEDRYYSLDEFKRCATKFRHVNVLTAIEHAKSIQRSIPLSKPKMYSCPFCDGLHLTSGRKHKDIDALSESLHHLDKMMSHANFSKAPASVQVRNREIRRLIIERLKEVV